MRGHRVAGHINDVEPEEGQLRQADLQLEGLFPDRVESVSRGHLRLVLAAVARKADDLKIVKYQFKIIIWSICQFL